MTIRKHTRFDLLSRGLVRRRGEMNRTETAYAEYLSTCDDVAAWWFEPLSLRLSHPESGQPAKVSPDFLVLMRDGSTFLDDVKSGGLDDYASIVRMKAAAEIYPLWRFRLIKPIAKKHGGGFSFEVV